MAGDKLIETPSEKDQGEEPGPAVTGKSPILLPEQRKRVVEAIRERVSDTASDNEGFPAERRQE